MISLFKTHSFSSLYGSRRLRQIGSLYSAVIINIALGFVTSVMNTRMLGPEAYGDLRFINGAYQFLATVSTFGLFTTGGQLLAQEKDNLANRKGLIGGLIVIAGIVSLLFIGVVSVFAVFEPIVFGNQLTFAIIVFSPLLAVWIFQPCVEMILQGENQIHQLSFFRILPGFSYMVLLLLFNLFFPPNLTATLLAQVLSGILTTIVLMMRLKPDFANLARFRRMIWEANKVYGLHVYVGILSGVATAYLSTFVISYFLDNTQVGFFSLAVTLTVPLTQISSVVGTTYFKDFAHSDHMPGKVTLVTGGLTLVSILAFVGLIHPLIHLVYTTKFIAVASLSQIMALGAGLYGMGDYYNRFLGAHGKGRELRNGAIAVGLVNVLGYLFLVKLIGIDGAAITRLFAGIVYFGMMVFYYRKFRRAAVAIEAVPAPAENAV